MLTKNEMNTLNLVYDLGCKLFTIPFCWKDGGMSLKPKSKKGVLCNCIVSLLILSSLVLKSVMLLQIKDINGLILGGMILICCLGNVVFQITIWMYQAELTQLINQVLHMNLSWGKYTVAHYL